jgi:lipopolysaccharide export system permease protein
MKIYFRYLFFRLLVPFVVCLFAGAVIWIMVDLYGNIYDFIEHKAPFRLVVWFYLLKLPSMLVQFLPATILVASLWTLLSLNRRSELVALQSGGMSPIWLFTPFFLFAAIWAAVLAYDLSGPATLSQVKSDQLLQQVKGQDARSNVFHNLPYVDNANRRVWFFQTLDTGHNKAEDMELLFRDAQGHDMEKYFAHAARWNDGFWKLNGVREIIYGNEDTVKDFEQLDLPDVTTPPTQLSLIISQAEQLTLPQLSQYIATSTSSQEHLAGFRTEWWYRVLQPFSLFVLLLFALLNGMHTDRRGAARGWAWSIAVLFAYIVCQATLMPFGRFNRMSPFVSVVATEVIFGALGIHLLAVKYGWYWQLGEHWKEWRAGSAGRQDTAL